MNEETVGAMLLPDAGNQIRHQIFLDINANASKPSKSLATLFDERDRLAKVTRNLLALPWMERYTNLERTTLPKSSGDLFTLMSEGEHPHGLSNRDFDSLFTPDKPVSFNFHGYPWLIHKLVFRRSHQERIHVRGYKEEGNINTPLELAINNQVDRFNLVIDVIDRVPNLGSAAAHVKERMKNQIIECLAYAHEHGKDQDDMSNWKWPYS